MKKTLISILLLAIVMLVLSCDSTSSPINKESFSLEVRLKNSNNEPLTGYRASIFPKYDNLYSCKDNDRAEVTIMFSIPQDSYVKVEIYDYFDNFQRLLMDEPRQAGYTQLVWHPGIDTKDGIYKAIMTVNDSSTLLDSLSCYLYKYTQTDLNQAFYHTDEYGQINEASKLSFPYLYFQSDFTIVDPQGTSLSLLEFSPETSIIMANNEGESKRFNFNITNGKNIIELNWDQMESVDSEDEKVIQKIGERVTESINYYKDNDGGLPPTTSIRAFPNPFN
ncbi:hypothetical protein JEZ13_02255 [bacterium]|nr:hypothetical protein [bacterium]